MTANNPLSDSYSKLAAEEQRRKRRAELQAQLNKLQAEQATKRIITGGGQLVDTAASVSMQSQITDLREEFDKLNY
jgi:hypothetical protein